MHVKNAMRSPHTYILKNHATPLLNIVFLLENPKANCFTFVLPNYKFPFVCILYTYEYLIVFIFFIIVTVKLTVLKLRIL